MGVMSDYHRTRVLVLAAGLAVLALTALVLQARAIDPEEILAVTFFLPVFAAAVLGGLRWAVPTGAIAAVGYYVLRADDLAVLSSSAQWTRPLSYGVAYIAFGALAGWAAGELTTGIRKLDRFDVTDGESELLNARGLHRQLEQEVARARRYGSDFAVVTVSFDIDGDRGDRRDVRRRVGEVVRGSVRSVDDTGRITVDGRDVVIAVLPETQRDGAEVAGRKVLDQLRRDASAQDAEVRWLTHPEDDDAIDDLLATLESVVMREHPETMSRG